MNDAIRLLSTAMGGAACAAFFFGGLWWTIRRALSSKRPAIWLLGSLLVRTGSTVTGLAWLGQLDLRRILFCLGGFIGMRLVAQILIVAPTS